MILSTKNELSKKIFKLNSSSLSWGMGFDILRI